MIVLHCHVLPPETDDDVGLIRQHVRDFSFPHRPNWRLPAFLTICLFPLLHYGLRGLRFCFVLSRQWASVSCFVLSCSGTSIPLRSISVYGLPYGISSGNLLSCSMTHCRLPIPHCHRVYHSSKHIISKVNIIYAFHGFSYIIDFSINLQRPPAGET